jgi:hypothetical protein
LLLLLSLICSTWSVLLDQIDPLMPPIPATLRDAARHVCALHRLLLPLGPP